MSVRSQAIKRHKHDLDTDLKDIDDLTDTDDMRLLFDCIDFHIENLRLLYGVPRKEQT